MLIKLKCDYCDTIYDVVRTREMLPETKSLTCNWCPKCEGDAMDYYTETQHPNEIFGEPDPNQLKLEIPK